MTWSPDATDRKILKRLHEDGRASFASIAEDLDIPESAVESRVETMSEEGVITRFTALTDPTKLGYISVAFGITADPHQTDAIAQTLKDHENIYKVWILSGKHNIIVHASFADIEEFQTFNHETLHNLDGIVQYESSIVTQSVISEGSVVLAENE